MIYLIVLTLASASAAARLENIFLPPHSGSSSGANVGLKTPYYSGTNEANLGHETPYHGSNSVSSSSSSQAQILRYENEMDQRGWHYAYETSDGTKAEQDGQIIPGPVPEKGSLKVSGAFSYIGDDGQTYSVSYTADENGFHPVGDHLPTPPPIPVEILESLKLNAGNGGQYSSHKTSYDADAGY